MRTSIRTSTRWNSLCPFVLIAWTAIAATPWAATTINTDVNLDTTWTSPGSPYVITTSVDVTAVLTIEPGVLVEFNNGTELNIRGNIVAEGTETDRIVFTGSTASPGSWEGINIIGNPGSLNTGSKFSYADIEFGGNYYANIYLDYASVTLRHCAIRESSRDGIYGSYESVAHAYDSEFSNNAGYAINFYDGSNEARLERLTAGGNAHDAVAIGYGTIRGKHVWENCGIPYDITSNVTVHENATLYVRPGAIVRFESGVYLLAYGRIVAVGSEAEPILFTGTTLTPGWWSGISILGTPENPNAGSIFEQCIIEYGGGYYANVYIDQAQVAISRCTIQHSSADGIYLYYGGNSSTLERSRIIDNAGYAVQHYNNTEPTNMLFAPHNWWGDPSGPQHSCNSGGTGGQVTDGVAFTPFLTSPTDDPGPAAPADARILTITPQTWYALADGVSRIWVKITLRDGEGRPLPGRTVNLTSTLGTVSLGGITNFNGESLAYLTSNTPGNARLTATLNFTNTCETARSPSAEVTFSNDAKSRLMPNMQAPYVNNHVDISPLPVTRGVPTHVSVWLDNPNTYPITVDGTFSVTGYGIGLTFGPVATVNGQVIAANSSGTIAATWTPLVSGKFCVDFHYRITNPPPGIAKEDHHEGTGRSNVQVASGPLGSPRGKETLRRAEVATGAMNHDGVTVGLNVRSPEAIPYQWIHSYLIGRHLDWMFQTTRRISRALGGDPPLQDYASYQIPIKPSFPLATPGGGLTAGRAAAINAMTDALADAVWAGRAAAISLDRYGGASAASDLVWASQQAAALIYYQREFGGYLLVLADRMEALLAQAQGEGYVDDVLTVQQVRNYQQAIRSGGFLPIEINAARALGMTDTEIESVRQDVIAADPEDVTLSRVQYVNELVQASRELGNELLSSANYGGAGSSPIGRAADNELVRVYETSTDFQVGNPTASTANVELRMRRLDLPPDWMIDVRPTSVSLAAGAVTTATVTVSAGAPSIQGTKPRLAVEAFIGTELIGGIALDVLIPRAAFFEYRAPAARWKGYR